jgi:hypothetical protein
MIRTLLRVGALALAASAFVCDGKGPDFFGPGSASPKTGNIEGLVLNGTTPIAGAPVAITGSQSGSTTSGADGKYSFLNWNGGDVTVSATPVFYACTSRTASISIGVTTVVNIACTPQPGTVAGTVRIGTTVAPGVDVTLSNPANGNTLFTVKTGANGTYAFSSITPGNYNVSIAVPAGTTCPNNPRAVAVTSGQTTTADFNCTPSTGSIGGTVTLDGAPAAGVAVVARVGASTIGTATTAADGTYVIGNLTPGLYVVSVTPPPNAVCPNNPRDALVQANQVATENFSCVTQKTGVTGTVRLDGNLGQGGFTVTVSQGGTQVASAVTDLFGNYGIDLPPGSYTIAVTQPGGVVCSPSPQSFTVTNTYEVRNFACQTLFMINFSDPSPSYRHVGPGNSFVCSGITTSPAQPGAGFVVQWTGPGLVGTSMRSGTLDASGKATDKQDINQFGTYTLNAQVTVGTTVTQSQVDVAVAAAQGNCVP